MRNSHRRSVRRIVGAQVARVGQNPRYMPFTLAHPAAALPFRRFWKDGFFALAIGTLGPDIPYFMPGRYLRISPNLHNSSGAILYGAPIAFALLCVLVLLRPVLVEPLWGKHRVFVNAGLSRFERVPRLWLHAVPAVVVGSAIHYVCDSFTHRYGWFVDRLPVLQTILGEIGGRPLTMYVLLQYLSSVAGLWLLLWWYRRQLRAISITPALPARSWRPWVIGAICMVCLLLGINAEQHAPPRFDTPHGITFITLTTAMRAFAVLYVVLGAALLIAARCSPPAGSLPDRARRPEA